MKTSAKTAILTGRERVFKSFALIISSLFLFAYTAQAQEGPSLGNLNKNMDAAKNQLSHDEMVQYIYMGVGFALVIAIAWFSTSLAKKRKLAEDEERAKRHLHVKHSTHDPYFNSREHGHAHTHTHTHTNAPSQKVRK